MYGLDWELAHYVDGTWVAKPRIHSDYFRLPLAIGINIIGRGWAIETIRFDLLYGELPPGRYMFMRTFSRSVSPDDKEHLRFNFVITENTPAYIDFNTPRLVIQQVAFVVTRLCMFVGVWITAVPIIKKWLASVL